MKGEEVRYILAIDTSFDETSVSVVHGLRVLSNIMPSQMEYHQKYGGVVPSLAKLAHEDRIDNVVFEALKKARVNIQDINLLAVTYGPGLAMPLEVGIKKAIELSKEYRIPLMLINHMEGHLLSCFANSLTRIKREDGKEELSDDLKKLEREKALVEDSILDLEKISEVKFPSLGLLVSGGHTELILVKDFFNYEKIGDTLDDACGECFDKCGRMLGLGYPAGAVITEFSKKNRNNVEIFFGKSNSGQYTRVANIQSKREYLLTIPMTNSKDLNFSYSGIKTAFKKLLDLNQPLDKNRIYDLAITFETAALQQLIIKLEEAVKIYKPKEIWLGGGVIASARLRFLVRNLCKRNNIEMRAPYSNKITGDNAVMIGICAYIKSLRMDEVSHNPKDLIFESDYELIDRDPSLTL